MRIVIVGGGVLGTLHAWWAIRRGHEVVHLERELEARGASVRNFGLVMISGRARGAELDAALRGRAWWEAIGQEIPSVGFRARGLMTVCRTETEAAVAAEAVQAPDASERRWALLDPSQARALNPALGGDFLCALYCAADALVEPTRALPALRAGLAPSGRYRWLPGREVRGISSGVARDDHGEEHGGDQIVLLPGAASRGLVRELAGELPLRLVRLQMMQTAPPEVPLTTAVADADSFLYYPAYRFTALERLSAATRAPIASERRMQLLIAPRPDGSLTIGDTHEYVEPFPTRVDEAPYQHMAGVAGSILGAPLPPIVSRWSGVYAQHLDSEELVLRRQLCPGLYLVAGPGGRGMTCAPAIAEATADQLRW